MSFAHWHDDHGDCDGDSDSLSYCGGCFDDCCCSWRYRVAFQVGVGGPGDSVWPLETWT